MLVPGDSIDVEPGFLRGHGTHLEDEELVSSLCGRPMRVNKLVSVVPNKRKYAVARNR